MSEANRAGRGRAQAVRAAMRDTTQEVENSVRTAMDESEEMIGSVADTVSHTADVAVDISQRVANQGREVVWLGMRAAAGMNGRLADVSYGTGHRFLEQAAHAIDIYGRATDSTADNLRALFNASLSLGRGMQQMQQTWLTLLDRSMHESARKPQDLLRCKSPIEFADAQREIFVQTVERAIESTTTMLQLAERVARDAIGPLQGRARADAGE
jgi:hypothetical protein